MSDATTQSAEIAETRAALRAEIGPPTDRDHNWQPMVSAAEVRTLLDALDRAEALAEKWNSTPDYDLTEYDRGRVDQRHDMTTELCEALLYRPELSADPS